MVKQGCSNCIHRKSAIRTYYNCNDCYRCCYNPYVTENNWELDPDIVGEWKKDEDSLI